MHLPDSIHSFGSFSCDLVTLWKSGFLNGFKSIQFSIMNEATGLRIGLSQFSHSCKIPFNTMHYAHMHVTFMHLECIVYASCLLNASIGLLNQFSIDIYCNWILASNLFCVCLFRIYKKWIEDYIDSVSTIYTYMNSDWTLEHLVISGKSIFSSISVFEQKKKKKKQRVKIASNGKCCLAIQFVD